MVEYALGRHETGKLTVRKPKKPIELYDSRRIESAGPMIYLQYTMFINVSQSLCLYQLAPEHCGGWICPKPARGIISWHFVCQGMVFRSKHVKDARQNMHEPHVQPLLDDPCFRWRKKKQLTTHQREPSTLHPNIIKIAKEPNLTLAWRAFLGPKKKTPKSGE